jgi:hypothetical protein
VLTRYKLLRQLPFQGNIVASYHPTSELGEVASRIFSPVAARNSTYTGVNLEPRMLHRQYIEEIHRNIGYLPTWIPSTYLQVGDVVVFENGGFRRVNRLHDLGIEARFETDLSLVTYDYASAGAVTIRAKAAGDDPAAGSTLGKTDAGLFVEFSRANAILFRAEDCQVSSIVNQDSLGKEIEFRYEKGDWSKDRFIVTEVVSAASATIIISSASNAKLDLVARGSVKGGTLSLADVKANFDVVSFTDIGIKIVADTDLTPMFRSSGIMKRLFRRSVFAGRGKQRTDNTIVDEDVRYGFITPERLLEA